MLQKSRQQQRSKLGKEGEAIAVSYLLKKHYRILERNFKARYGEIDIVALDGDTLVFVEVKTRSSRLYGTPEEAITPWKLRELAKTAQYYHLLHPEHTGGMRIDVLAFILDPLTRNILHFQHVRNVTL